jgi:hypothetical protein
LVSVLSSRWATFVHVKTLLVQLTLDDSPAVMEIQIPADLPYAPASLVAHYRRHVRSLLFSQSNDYSMVDEISPDFCDTCTVWRFIAINIRPAFIVTMVVATSLRPQLVHLHNRARTASKRLEAVPGGPAGLGNELSRGMLQY